MRVWGWYRARRWWVQLLLAFIVLPLTSALLYVGFRSLQYASSEKDPGVYVPSTANVVVRMRDLENQLRRIQEAPAWRTFDRKLLRDPVLRRQINEILKAYGAPTLDDLEDERKPFAKNQDRVIHAIGADLVGSLQVKESLARMHFCVIVRLRWLHYLATPFARLVLPTEEVGGEKVLVIKQGTREIRVAFVGALAIVSSDKALLEQALQRKGRVEDGGRPVEGRVVFEGSPGLLEIRKTIQNSGLFPYVKWETARGVTGSGDIRDTMMVFDATFDKAEPLHATEPPVAIRSWAPVATSGLLVTSTGGQDLIAWLRSLVVPGSKDPVAQVIRDALQALDDGGLAAKVLPLLQDGMAVMTGLEEQGGQVVPALTLVFASSDPAAAVEGLNGLVRKIAGSWGDSKYFTSEPVGGTMVYSWSWPPALQIASLANPTYAALKGTLVIGSNRQFTLDVIRAAEQGEGFEQTSAFRKLRSRMKELGMSTEPTVAGGLLYPPQLREALSGSLSHLAKLTTPINGPALRAELEADRRRQGQPLDEEEIRRAFNEAIDRKIDDKEAEFRRALSPMDAFRWAAFDASTGPKGIVFKLAVELR
jgi:hypothetical protein